MINAEVQKAGSESAPSIIRKFSRRVQGTDLIRNARANRYFSRSSSKTVKKKKALKRIAKREAFARLVKEGKIAEPVPRRQPQQRENAPQKVGLESTPIAR